MQAKIRHQYLVQRRRVVAAINAVESNPISTEITKEEKEKQLKQLDREIGRLASAYNPLISAKAQAWLKEKGMEI